MKQASIEDKVLIIDILSKSFDTNQSVNFIVKPDSKRLQRIRFLMEYSFDVCWYFGKVWLSEDRKACALVFYPHLKRTTLTSIWLDIKLIIL